MGKIQADMTAGMTFPVNLRLDILCQTINEKSSEILVLSAQHPKERIFLQKFYVKFSDYAKISP
jgi:hypothetical protein